MVVGGGGVMICTGELLAVVQVSADWIGVEKTVMCFNIAQSLKDILAYATMWSCNC